MRRCIATALAHLSTEEDRRVIFAAGAPCGALEVLLDMLIVAPVRPVASSSSRKGVDGVAAAEAATLASAAAAAQAQVRASAATHPLWLCARRAPSVYAYVARHFVRHAASFLCGAPRLRAAFR
jgi:hypothetical protein